MVKKISVVTPCYNEEAGIAECYEAVKRIFDDKLQAYEREHIFIDNCSADRTVAILRDIAARDRNVKIIVNARNFGHARSPYYGMLQASGDAVVPILADLQTPPALIPEMVDRWLEGFKVVVAVRRASREGFVARLARNGYYALIKRISKVEQIANYIGFGLYDRAFMDIARTIYEPEPYFRGLVPEIGFERAVVEYVQPERRHGRSRNSFWTLIDLAFLGLSTHSKAPMRAMTVAGITIAGFSLLAAVFYLALKLVFWDSVPIGIAPLLFATFFLGAVQLLALGLIGEYVALLLQYARRFPLVVEKERINFES